jgi:thiol-disulfide isomerase/thioredoxin
MAIRMSKKTWIILAIVIIAVGATAGIALSRNSSSPTDITLPIITWNDTTLSELEGTPVVLVFWATWCPHCPAELHRLEAVAQQSEGEINIIAINIGQSASAVQKFFGDYEPTMIVALDADGKVFMDYCQHYNNPRAYIPFTLFINSEGIVRYTKIGAFASETALWDALNSVF